MAINQYLKKQLKKEGAKLLEFDTDAFHRYSISIKERIRIQHALSDHHGKGPYQEAVQGKDEEKTVVMDADEVQHEQMKPKEERTKRRHSMIDSDAFSLSMLDDEHGDEFEGETSKLPVE